MHAARLCKMAHITMQKSTSGKAKEHVSHDKRAHTAKSDATHCPTNRRKSLTTSVLTAMQNIARRSTVSDILTKTMWFTPF